jgi:hypothetical protein
MTCDRRHQRFDGGCEKPVQVYKMRNKIVNTFSFSQSICSSDYSIMHDPLKITRKMRANTQPNRLAVNRLALTRIESFDPIVSSVLKDPCRLHGPHRSVSNPIFHPPSKDAALGKRRIIGDGEIWASRSR